MKVCTLCKEDKDETEFNLHRGGRFSHCKQCRKAYRKDHYQKNKQYYFEQAVARKTRNLRFLFDYLVEHPCVKCGERNPIFLDFDHIDPEDKTDQVAKLANNGLSIKNLKQEIAKCQILCVKCHRLRTAKQFGWYKYLSKEERNKCLNVA